MALFSYTPASRHVIGDVVMRIFNAVSGASGSTIMVPATNVLFIDLQPGSLITGFTTAPSIQNGAVIGTVLTLTSSGPLVNEKVKLITTT